MWSISSPECVSFLSVNILSELKVIQYQYQSLTYKNDRERGFRKENITFFFFLRKHFVAIVCTHLDASFYNLRSCLGTDYNY